MPADLVTRLLLQNEQFDRNLKESRAQLQAFNKRIEAGAASVRSFVAGFAGLAGVSFAFMDIAQKSIQFEKSLSSLRSLTGLSAKDMEFFKQKAIELGSTSTQTASQVVEAFQLIGSQQPELLKNKEALAEVTKQAIILAEAAGMDVPEAAKALSGSINQMGESADVAGEYINILAAASQAGSADIQYLAKAIEKSGGAASSVGVKYNELVASIEAIAPKITEASEAGTNLRNIFLTLESSSDKNLKPSVVGLTKALDNLAAKNLDATQMTKMFGKESVTAALAIVNAKEDYKKYIEAITGTNTALEQQKINNDNLAGSLNNISSAWEGFVLTLNKSNGALKESADLFTAIIYRMTEAIKSEEQKQEEAISKAVSNEIKNMDRLIKSWEDYGYSRAEAISKSIDLQEKDNGGGVGLSNQLRQAEIKLADIRSQINILTEKGKGFNRRSYQEGIELDNLINQEESQKEIVAQLQIKNSAYRESIQYLRDQLLLTNQINEKTKESKVAGENSNSPVKIPIQLGSEKDLENKIRALSDKISSEANPEIKFDLLRQQENLKKQLEEIRKNNKLIVDLVFNIKPIESPGLDKKEGKKPSDKLEEYRGELNKQASANIDKEMSAYQKAKEEMEELQTGVNSVGMAFQSLSGIMGKSSADWFSWAGNMATAISTVLPLMKTLVNANKATAISGAAASAASVPVVGWVTAIGAVASIAGLLANLPSFATGGIVPGSSFSGDKVLARVNSGEMILNQIQQGKLYNLIQDGGKKQEIHITGELVGRGSNLVAVVDNYGRKQGRIK
ncbi:phage tail tape measure protein [Parabacteroides goldsteinii]|uniref:phage tail tape measure protein n=1 Tax=Parabacteroides goldsteinii TaxID=328812 RepID=UPI0022E43161|nr:phage tail tape measure protein [Parabacteroides goldsteinii]